VLQVLRLWARILLAIPRSRLVLKNKPFACDTARAHVLNLLAAEVSQEGQADRQLCGYCTRGVVHHRAGARQRPVSTGLTRVDAHLQQSTIGQVVTDMGSTGPCQRLALPEHIIVLLAAGH
jgi:hypothetical protein